MPLPPREIEDVEAIPEGWMQMIPCAEMHGVSKPTLEAWIRLDRIATKLVRVPPGQSRRGTRVLRIVRTADVTRAIAKVRDRARLVNATPGKIAQRAFAMLDAGSGIRALVVKLGVTEGYASEIVKRWRAAGEAPLELGAVAKARLESLVGPFATIEELVKQVAALSERAKGS